MTFKTHSLVARTVKPTTQDDGCDLHCDGAERAWETLDAPLCRVEERHSRKTFWRKIQPRPQAPQSPSLSRQLSGVHPEHLLRCAQLRCPQHASHELCQIHVFFNPRVDDGGAAASLGRWSERSRLRPSQAHVWASVWAQPLGSHIPPAIPPALPHAVGVYYMWFSPPLPCRPERPCPGSRRVLGTADSFPGSPGQP